MTSIHPGGNPSAPPPYDSAYPPTQGYGPPPPAYGSGPAYPPQGYPSQGYPPPPQGYGPPPPAGGYGQPGYYQQQPYGYGHPAGTYQQPPAGAYQQPPQQVVYVHEDRHKDRDNSAETCCLLALCSALVCCCLWD